MTQNNELSRKQAQLIMAMLTTNTLQEACSQVGISDDTGRRYLAMPHVKTAYDEAKQAMFTQSLNALLSVPVEAIATLRRNLAEDVPPAQQVSAAKILLDKAIDVHKMAELESRISELETRLSEKGMEGNGLRRIK